jgi:hypothetical protein
MVKFVLLLRPRCFSDGLDPDLCFSHFWMFDYSLPADCGVVTKTAPLPVALFKGWICVSDSFRWGFGCKVVGGDGDDGAASSGGGCCLLWRWSSGSGVEVVVVGEGDEMVLWW